MGTIDFGNIMSDMVAGYLPEQSIIKMKDYFKRKAIATPTYKKSLAWARAGLLILCTYRFGRRVSEMVGKSRKLTIYPGLRPCDLVPGKSIIIFHILKKGHVKLKDKRGKLRDEKVVLKEQLNKPPKKVSIGIDKGAYNTLSKFIRKHEIGYYDRIFPICRSRADQLIKEAASACGIVLPGTRIIKDPVTKMPVSHRKQVHFHHLRHSFAIHFLKKNKNNPQALTQLQDLLCHSSIEVTKAYLQFGQEDRIDLLTQTFSPESMEAPIETFEKIEEPEHDADDDKPAKVV